MNAGLNSLKCKEDMYKVYIFYSLKPWEITLFSVTDWYRQATRNYLNQYWIISMTRHGVTRPQIFCEKKHGKQWVIVQKYTLRMATVVTWCMIFHAVIPLLPNWNIWNYYTYIYIYIYMATFGLFHHVSSEITSLHNDPVLPYSLDAVFTHSSPNLLIFTTDTKHGSKNIKLGNNFLVAL